MPSDERDIKGNTKAKTPVSTPIVKRDNLKSHSFFSRREEKGKEKTIFDLIFPEGVEYHDLSPKSDDKTSAPRPVIKYDKPTEFQNVVVKISILKYLSNRLNLDEETRQTLTKHMQDIRIHSYDLTGVNREEFIKTAQQRFNAIILELSKSYQKELCNAIQSMFQNNFDFIDRLPKEILSQWNFCTDEYPTTDYLKLMFNIMHEFPKLMQQQSLEAIVNDLKKLITLYFYDEKIPVSQYLADMKISIDAVAGEFYKKKIESKYILYDAVLTAKVLKQIPSSKARLNYFIDLLTYTEHEHPHVMNGNELIYDEATMQREGINLKALLSENLSLFKKFCTTYVYKEYDAGRKYLWQFLLAEDFIRCFIRALETFRTDDELTLLIQEAQINLKDIAQKSAHASKLIAEHPLLSKISQQQNEFKQEMKGEEKGNLPSVGAHCWVPYLPREVRFPSMPTKFEMLLMNFSLVCEFIKKTANNPSNMLGQKEEIAEVMRLLEEIKNVTKEVKKVKKAEKKINEIISTVASLYSFDHSSDLCFQLPPAFFQTLTTDSYFLNKKQLVKLFYEHPYLLKLHSLQFQLDIITQISADRCLKPFLKKIGISFVDAIVAHCRKNRINIHQMMRREPIIHARWILSFPKEERLQQYRLFTSSLNGCEIFYDDHALADAGLNIKEMMLESIPNHLRYFYDIEADQPFSVGISGTSASHLWQTLTPTVLIESIIQILPRFKSLNETKQFLTKSHIDLIAVARLSQSAAKLILQSETLSAILTADQLMQLRKTTHFSADEKLPAFERINKRKDLEFLPEDIIALSDHYNANLQEFCLKLKQTMGDQKDGDQLYKIKRIEQMQRELANFRQQFIVSGDALFDIDKYTFNVKAFIKMMDARLQDLIKDSDVKDEKSTKKASNQNLDAMKKCVKTLQKILDHLENMQYPNVAKDLLANSYAGKCFMKDFLDGRYNKFVDDKFAPGIRDAFTLPPVVPGLNPPIPKLIHYHWFGKPLPVKYFRNILNTHQNAEAYKIILWTNNPKKVLNKVRAELGTETEDAFKKVVKIVDINLLLAEVKKITSPTIYKLIETIMIREMGWTESVGREGVTSTGLANLALVSDLTRMLGLMLMGGIYADTDLEACGEINFSAPNYGFMREHAQNCLLVSCANHPLLRMAVTQLLTNYECELFTVRGRFTQRDVRRSFIELPGTNDLSNRLDSTLRLSGPNLLSHCIAKYIAQGGMLGDPTAHRLRFRIICDASWVPEKQRHESLKTGKKDSIAKRFDI